MIQTENKVDGVADAAPETLDGITFESEGGHREIARAAIGDVIGEIDFGRTTYDDDTLPVQWLARRAGVAEWHPMRSRAEARANLVSWYYNNKAMIRAWAEARRA